MHSNDTNLIPRHGGYRRLKSFQLARLVYDVTVRFCERYVSAYSRTRDQMIQAARSGVQNIAEGSQASAASRKIELKLTSVARASLEELRLDYEDFLRQRGLAVWPRSDPRRETLIDLRPTTADEVAKWVAVIRQRNRPAPSFPEIAANGALVLIAVANGLLDRQLASLARAFESEGGFTERLYRIRKQKREGRD